MRPNIKSSHTVEIYGDNWNPEHGTWSHFLFSMYAARWLARVTSGGASPSILGVSPPTPTPTLAPPPKQDEGQTCCGEDPSKTNPSWSKSPSHSPCSPTPPYSKCGEITGDLSFPRWLTLWGKKALLSYQSSFLSRFWLWVHIISHWICSE